MFSNGLFSFGLAGPLALLVLGVPVIGLLCSGIAIISRLRVNSGPIVKESQPKIDWAISILAASVVLAIIGALFGYFGFWETWMTFAAIGIFLFCPISAALTIWGKGDGRNVLLAGHGLIVLWISWLFLFAWIHGLL